jgi:hypothetical protein
MEKEVKRTSEVIKEEEEKEGGEKWEDTNSDKSSGEGEDDDDTDTDGEGESDEEEELEEFEAAMSSYTTQLFLADLIKVLDFDKTQINIRCPKLIEESFFFFDESLQRKVHLYEHIILLAHGFCRSGFLKIITNKTSIDEESYYRISKPYEVGFNKFFDTVVTFVSAYQGDIETFSKYCKGLLQALELEGNADFSAREKALKTLMLANGASIESVLADYGSSDNLYSEIFKTLFGKQYIKAMYLHKFATLNEDEFKNVFTVQDKQFKESKDLEAQRLSKFLLDEFLIKHLEMDNDSFEWLK